MLAEAGLLANHAATNSSESRSNLKASECPREARFWIDERIGLIEDPWQAQENGTSRLVRDFA
jgi:hypothetical protein